MAAFDWKPAALGGALILKCFVAVAACNQHDQEKAGQTITTAADHVADAGTKELKREWNEMNVKVESSDPGSGRPATPILGTRDGGFSVPKSAP